MRRSRVSSPPRVRRSSGSLSYTGIFRKPQNCTSLPSIPAAQGAGVGRLLVDTIVAQLQADGCAMLTVHTVGPSFEHAGYAATRAFYRALGFIPLEEHEGLDWSGPTLILVRPLREPSGS